MRGLTCAKNCAPRPSTRTPYPGPVVKNHLRRVGVAIVGHAGRNEVRKSCELYGVNLSALLARAGGCPACGSGEKNGGDGERECVGCRRSARWTPTCAGQVCC